MSLERLFEDRKCRKYIIDSVNEAKEYGIGICDGCGRETELLEAFGGHICADCADICIEDANNYNKVFNRVCNEDVIRTLNKSYVGINEANLVIDLKTLEKDATNNGTDISTYVKTKYNFALPKSSIETNKGTIYVDNNTVIRKGNSKINQFIIDYNCEFTTVAAGSLLVPDPDGTKADIIVKGKKISDDDLQAAQANSNKVKSVINKATSAAKTSKASSSKSVSTVSVGGIGIEDNGNNSYTIKISNKTEINIKAVPAGNVSDNMLVTLECDGNRHSITMKADKFKDRNVVLAEVKGILIQNPGLLFTAFAEEGKEGIEINRYGIVKFIFDEKSFDGKLYMVPVWQGEKAKHDKAYISDKALNNRAVLVSDLTEYVTDYIEQCYPIFAGKNSIIKTSLGPLLVELVKQDKTKKEILVNCEVANKHFEITLPIGAMYEKSLDVCKQTILNSVLKNLSSIITDAKDKTITKSGIDYKFSEDIDGNSVEIYAIPDENKFMDKGSLTFNVTITVKGQKFSKDVVVTNKVKKLKDFLTKTAEEMYKENAKSTNMTTTMTSSAQNKMKVPSRKFALLSRIIDDYINYNMITYPMLGEVDTQLDMSVNKDGKVTDIKLIITDVDGYYTNFKDFEKDCKEIKLFKVSKKNEKNRDGFQIVLTCTDIESASKEFNLPAYESAIMEAYDIILEGKVSRKTISI